jgi:serine/threonine-protein kinase RsbW
MDQIEHLSDQIALKMNLKKDDQENLTIAITEVVSNAIIHGNKKDSTKKVSIDCQCNKNHIQVIIRDEGKGFKLNTLTDPTRPENIMKESGRGIYILKALMDHVDYHFTANGTEVILTKTYK